MVADVSMKPNIQRHISQSSSVEKIIAGMQFRIPEPRLQLYQSNRFGGPENLPVHTNDYEVQQQQKHPPKTIRLIQLQTRLRYSELHPCNYFFY